MESFFELASTRRSIRKYADREVPDEDIEYFIKSAVTAPSGCNSQCWQFVAVRDKAVTTRLADAVKQAIAEFCAGMPENEYTVYVEKKAKMATFFRNAPLVIAVFMTGMEYYDKRFVELYRNKGVDDRAMMADMSFPDVLSVGAAVQNLLLAVHEKGYGACWMNEPALAGERVNKILGVPASHRFMSLIPIGVPAYTPRVKNLRPMDEVFKAIE